MKIKYTCFSVDLIESEKFQNHTQVSKQIIKKIKKNPIGKGGKTDLKHKYHKTNNKLHIKTSLLQILQ